MIELYSPQSESELMLLRSIFGGAGIRYFVHNDTFGSLTVGPRIESYNQKTIFVSQADYRDARDLLREFLSRTAGPARPASPGLSAIDKLRVVLEFLFFGWIMPGRRPVQRPTLRLVKGAGFRPDDHREGEPGGGPEAPPAGRCRARPGSPRDGR